MLSAQTIIIIVIVLYASASYWGREGQELLEQTLVVYFHPQLQDVLHDVPDFEERKKLLSELKNRLEALLSPQLISSFQSHNLMEAQRCVHIFNSIQCYSQLKNYYIGCHKVRVSTVSGDHGGLL